MSAPLHADSLRETVSLETKNVHENKGFIPYLPIEKGSEDKNRKLGNRKLGRERHVERNPSEEGYLTFNIYLRNVSLCKLRES